jgi:hypothetical protein
MRTGIVGLERDRAPKGRDRFALASEVAQRVTERIVPFGMIGRQRQELLEARGRLCRLPKFCEQFAAMQQHHDVVGAQDQCPVIGLDRFGRTSEPLEDQGTIGHDFGRDISLHGRLDQPQGFDIVAALGAKNRKPIEREGIRGVRLENGEIEPLRLFEAVLRLQLKAL